MKRAIIGYAVLAAIMVALSSAAIVLDADIVLIKGQAFSDTVCSLCSLAYLYALAIGFGIGFVRRVRQRLLCTYQTVAYLTFCGFTGASAVVLSYDFFAMVLTGTKFTLSKLIISMESLSTLFIYVSLPGVVLLSLFLLVSNIVLIKNEGLRPSNTLGILVGIAVAIAYGIMFSIDMALWRYTDPISVAVRIVIPYVINFFEAMGIATMVCAFLAVRHEPPLDRDFVIILGCAIRPDGTPMRLLAGRIDRALEFARKQEEQTGKRLTFVCSGGQGHDEVISEAASMAGYLRERGIDEERIILEDKSTSTRENMRFSRERIDEAWGEGRDERPKTAYSTTNYHVFRGGTFALQAGLEPEGLGAKTKWYFWPNAFLREFVGFIVAARGFVLVSLLAVLLFALSFVGAYETLSLTGYLA